MTVSLAVLAILAGTDLSLPNNANISAALVVAPFLASVGSRTTMVAPLGAFSVLVAVGLAVADGSGLHASAARLVVILVGTGVATEAARVRVRRERRLVDLTNVAQVAQAAIIRQPAALVGDVAVGSWYQTSVRAATVGGDCYEAFDTDFGTRLLVGDVRGHGLPGVRLAALVVGAFRALAHFEADLGKVAHELDLLVTRYAQDLGSPEVDGEEFVTAVMAEVRGPKVTFANCGHPPPHLQSVVIPGGGRVLLYTDGLMEARSPNGSFFDLESAAAVLGDGPLQEGVQAVIYALQKHSSGRLVDGGAMSAAYLDRDPTVVDHARRGAEELLRRPGRR